MQRKTFVKAVERYQKVLVRSLVLKHIAKDLAEDVFQNMVAQSLQNKIYQRVPHDTVDNKMKGYLMQAVTWQLKNELLRQKQQNATIRPLPEGDEEGDGVVQVEMDTEESITECPFCHKGVLNQYGACGLCHTILARDYATRETLTLDMMVETVCPDLSLFADVNLALAKLEPLERKVVLHIVHGNETLDDLVELTNMKRDALWRIWTRAKVKLQQELCEYSNVNG